MPDTMLPQIAPFDIVANGSRLGGSMIGSKKEAMEMLVSLPLSTANQVRLNNHDPGTCCEEEHSALDRGIPHEQNQGGS